MSAEITNLGRLMRLLDVSGNDLAAQTGINVTTISKWKNGRRRLARRSSDAETIATCLKTYCIGQKGEVVRRLLAQEYPTEVVTSENEQTLLARCLTEQPREKIQKMTMPNERPHAVIYTGEQGVETAILDFWQRVLLAEQPGEIYWLDNGDVDYANHPALVHGCIDAIMLSLFRGYHAVLLDTFPDEINPFLGFYRWMPFYLSRNVELLRCNVPTTKQLRYSIMAVPGQCALVSMGDDKMHYAALHEDAESVAFFAEAAKKECACAQVLMHPVPLQRPERLLQSVMRSLKQMYPAYFIHSSLDLHLMDNKALEQVIAANDMTMAEAETCRTIHKLSQRLNSRYQVRHLLYLNALENIMQVRSYQESMLSTVCGREIQVNSDVLMLQLEGLRRHAGNDFMLLVEPLGIIPETVSILLQDVGCVAVWDAVHYDTARLCTWPQLNGGHNAYVETHLAAMPKICQEQNWISNKIEHFIEMMAK